MNAARARWHDAAGGDAPAGAAPAPIRAGGAEDSELAAAAAAPSPLFPASFGGPARGGGAALGPGGAPALSIGHRVAALRLAALAAASAAAPLSPPPSSSSPSPLPSPSPSATNAPSLLRRSRQSSAAASRMPWARLSAGRGLPKLAPAAPVSRQRRAKRDAAPP